MQLLKGASLNLAVAIETFAVEIVRKSESWDSNCQGGGLGLGLWEQYGDLLNFSLAKIVLDSHINFNHLYTKGNDNLIWFI